MIIWITIIIAFIISLLIGIIIFAHTLTSSNSDESQKDEIQNAELKKAEIEKALIDSGLFKADSLNWIPEIILSNIDNGSKVIDLAIRK